MFFGIKKMERFIEIEIIDEKENTISIEEGIALIEKNKIKFEKNVPLLEFLINGKKFVYYKIFNDVLEVDE